MTEAGRKIRGFLALSCCLGVLAAVSTASAQNVLGPAKDKTNQISLEAQLPSDGMSMDEASQSSPTDEFQAAGNTRFAMGPNCLGCPMANNDGQIGIQGFGEQLCNDGQWVGTAKPLFATLFNTLTITLNTNRAGGDIYIMKNVPGACQPDITQIIATFCCGLDGLATDVQHKLALGALIAGDLEDPTWVVLTGRSGLNGTDFEDVPNGSSFPGHQNARDTLSGSAPGRYHFNLAGTGNPGDWSDAAGFGLGNCYDLDLSLDFPPPLDQMPVCGAAATGACCLDPVGGQDCQMTESHQCPQLGGVYLGDGTVCGEDACPQCGNGVDELGESCDGEDAELCFGGFCLDTCQCVCQTPIADGTCEEGEEGLACVGGGANAGAACEGDDDCAGAPANDCCFDRLEIGVGDTAYDTTNAQTDGVPSPDGLCNDFGSTQTGNDIWYNFNAECTGDLVVSTCGGDGTCNVEGVCVDEVCVGGLNEGADCASDISCGVCDSGPFTGFVGCGQDSDCDGGGPGGFAQYDSDLVLYEGCDECPPSADDVVVCNDDYDGAPCGTVLFASVLRTTVQAGQCYKLRAGGFGIGQFGPGVLFVDLVCSGTPESLIIKQGAVPAPVNPNSNGVIPMLLVGSDTLDVSTVDRDSLRLRRCDGVGGEWAPEADHTQIKDLNHPAATNACGGCSDNDDQSSDGVDDLSLKFRTDATLAELEIGVGDGVVGVELIGTSAAGDFTARDCLMVVPPGVGQAILTVGANVGDTFVEITPLDINVDSDGFANFSRGYISGTNITLSAPVTSEGRKFVRWSVNGVLQDMGTRTLTLTATEDMAVKAYYKRQGRLVPDSPRDNVGDLD